MKNYTCETCHEIGYGWNITAPEGLDEDDVKALVNSLIDYTDSPDEHSLRNMLKSGGYLPLLNHERLELLKQVKITVKSVHRNSFSQSFEAVP